jgi:dGTP triphosphohydrolase
MVNIIILFLAAFFLSSGLCATNLTPKKAQNREKIPASRPTNPRKGLGFNIPQETPEDIKKKEVLQKVSNYHLPKYLLDEKDKIVFSLQKSKETLEQRIFNLEGEIGHLKGTLESEHTLLEGIVNVKEKYIEYLRAENAELKSKYSTQSETINSLQLTLCTEVDLVNSLKKDLSMAQELIQRLEVVKADEREQYLSQIANLNAQISELILSNKENQALLLKAKVIQLLD